MPGFDQALQIVAIQVVAFRHEADFDAAAVRPDQSRPYVVQTQVVHGQVNRQSGGIDGLNQPLIQSASELRAGRIRRDP